MQRHGLLVLPNHACQIANSTSMLLLSREIETLYNVFNVNIAQIDASDVNTTVARLTLLLLQCLIFLHHLISIMLMLPVAYCAN